ncbi:hypothetical protein SADUNF_Sadunf11G0013000 [Salix dunnii]|uniref:Uncharacterized protein n=1 Tax=Salix dunnii TaxID=1413687 RepID=A0A835MST2_9ROSI|nr:hypothetical protein SADUNF_Sadunf11G0013000 [Salix dunnii]
MADSQHSSSDETFGFSRGTILLTLTFVVSSSLPKQLVGKHVNEETSQESKLEFSEDEETLIIRMFNLVGERNNRGRVNLNSSRSLSFDGDADRNGFLQSDRD